MPEVDVRSVVDPSARLADDVVVGPFCTVGPEVTIGAGTVLKSHVNLDGFTEIGANCTVWPFASVGTRTQDLKYKGGRPGVRIGEGTTLREYVTVNAATYDGDVTVVGNHCHIMAYAHVAHDCIVGNGVVMANAATLAFTGTVLGARVDRRFYAIPALITGFLFQHAIQGWCPPLPVLRRLGFRTATEISEERIALKILRGDFKDIPGLRLAKPD